MLGIIDREKYCRGICSDAYILTGVPETERLAAEKSTIHPLDVFIPEDADVDRAAGLILDAIKRKELEK